MSGAVCTHDANVQLGRITGRVRVFSDGIVRFTVPALPNFYSSPDWITPLEQKQIRQQRRRALHELIDAKFGPSEQRAGK